MHAFVVIFSNRNPRLSSSNSGSNSDFFFWFSFQQVSLGQPSPSSICFGLQFPEFSGIINQEFWGLESSLFVALCGGKIRCSVWVERRSKRPPMNCLGDACKLLCRAVAAFPLDSYPLMSFVLTFCLPNFFFLLPKLFNLWEALEGIWNFGDMLL